MKNAHDIRYLKSFNGIVKAFNDRHIPEPMSGCWLWTGYVEKKNYGRLISSRLPSGRALAHRLSWMIHRGPITPDQLICHKCDNPYCVNPDHLFIGDYASNNADRVKKQRSAVGQRSGLSKLKPEDVFKIRADPRSHRKIAVDYGVSHRTIGDVKNRVVWGHI